MKAREPFSFKEIQSIKHKVIPPRFLKASDGIQLAYYPFLNTSNKAIVILYSGAGLYGNNVYQWVAKTLNEKYQIGCYIFDIRGHGYSQGARGDAPSIKRVWLDVAEAVQWIKKQHPTTPLYLAGHSSGAGLIINYAAHLPDGLEEGYIFLAPYLGPKSETARLNEYSDTSFIRTVRSWVYVLGSMFPQSFVTHFKAIFFNYPDYILQSDPLILPFYTFIMSCATTPYAINILLDKIKKPVGLFAGKDDEQFFPEKIIAHKQLLNVPVHAEIVDAAHLSILLDAPQLIAKYIEAQINK